jgi:hypothetical protein
MNRLVSAIAILSALVLLTACGSHDESPPVTYLSGSGTLRVTGDTAFDTPLESFGTAGSKWRPPNEKRDVLEVQLPGADGLSLLVLSATLPRRGESTEFQESGVNFVAVERVVECQPSCPPDSYDSRFFSEECRLTLEKLTDQRVEGRVECSAIGASCSIDSQVLRTDPAACLRTKGERTISIDVTFALDDPQEDPDVQPLIYGDFPARQGLKGNP